MKRIAVLSLVTSLVVGLAAGVAGAADDQSWQALQNVKALAMSPQDMSQVAGKASLFDMLAKSGTLVSYGSYTLGFWSPYAGSAVAVTGSFGAYQYTGK